MKVYILLCLVTLVSTKSIDTDRTDFELLDGLFESNNQSYIVSGRPAKKCEFPSLVTLRITEHGKTFLCAGTLIDSKHVLTAAHCVAGKPQSVIISMGSISLAVSKSVFFATHIVPHEDFYRTPKALHNDIAVLTLHKPASISACIKPIPLARPFESFEGLTCLTAGWGKTAWKEPPSNVLRKVNLPVMTYKECHRRWPQVGHEHICAGDWIKGGAAPCQGDSGGPLLCKSNGQWVLAGIVSFGFQCEYGPALYTNVAYFRDWIDQHYR